MPVRNTETTYGSLTKAFHWLTVLLVCAVIPLGAIANGLAEQIRDPSTVATADDLTRAFRLFSLHKTVGVTIFFLGLIRLFWAVTQPKPAPIGPAGFQTVLAETVHVILYGSLIIVPLAGWISHAALPGYAPILWPFGQSLPFVEPRESTSLFFANLHRSLEAVMVLSLVLHIAGAMKRHLVDRDATLRRMLPGTVSVPVPETVRRRWLPFGLATAIWVAALSVAATM